MFGAYYYDFFSAFPDYAGSSIHIFGHSYGGMISIGATSLLTTAFKCGVLPAYMLPDMITMLDPYMMRCSVYDIPWLGDDTPDFGNICEVAYRTALDCQKLGITVRLFRFTKSVAYPATMNNFALKYGGDLNISYWNFVNNIIYAHLNDETIDVFSSMEKQHNYAWDWFTDYYTGKILTDAEAKLTEEQVLCFEMSYDASFARTGIKYSVDLSGTMKNTDDDVVSSFFREYKYDGADNDYPSSDVARSETAEEIAKLTGNAKIAGFVYLDRNKNGKLDERIRDHLSGAKIVVTNAAGEEILSSVTTVNGYYEVEVSEKGDYTVKVELPTGYVFSTEDADSEVTFSVVDEKHQLVLTNFGTSVQE